MSSSGAVEGTINKVVDEALQEMVGSLTDAYKSVLDGVDASERETILEVSRILEEKDRHGEILSRQIIGGAEMTARNRSLEMIEEGVNGVFRQALEKLEEAASQKNYEGTLKRLLEESIEAIEGDSLVVSGNRNDLQTLKRVVQEVGRERGVKIKVKREPIDSCGGVRAETPDGTIIYDNTFEARIERSKPFLRKEIARLFGK